MTDVLFQFQFVCHRLLPHFLFEYITLNIKTEWFFSKVYSQPVTTIKTVSPEQVGVD